MIIPEVTDFLASSFESQRPIFGSLLTQRIIPIRQELSILYLIKDTDSTAPKRGPVFIGLMSPDGAILSRYQRAVLMR